MLIVPLIKLLPEVSVTTELVVKAGKKGLSRAAKAAIAGTAAAGAAGAGAYAYNRKKKAQ